MVRPELVDEREWLRQIITPNSLRRMGIRPIDDELARTVFAESCQYLYGVITALPSSTVGADEMRLARCHGLSVATLNETLAGSLA